MSKKLRIFKGRSSKGIKGIELAENDSIISLSIVNSVKINGKIAKDVFEEMWNTGTSPEKIIENKGLKQVTDATQIGQIVDEALDQNPTQLEQYKAGKDKLFGFFVGQVMKISKGKANPKQVNKILKEKLEE